MATVRSTYYDEDAEPEDGGAMEQASPAPSSVEQQLDNFADASASPGPNEEKSDAGEQRPAESAAIKGGAAAPSDDDLKAAFKRGQEQKAAGHSRKALPGELRSNDALAKAWYAGFDGGLL